MSFELIDRCSRINWGNEFQSVGPATAKALSPYVLVLHLGNMSKLATIDLKERDGLYGVIKSER